MAHQPVDIAERLSLFSEHWSPKVVARLNDYDVKLVKIKGEFVWHSHDDTDELFLVIDGELREIEQVTHPVGLKSYRFQVADLVPGFHAIEVRVTAGNGDTFPESTNLGVMLMAPSGRPGSEVSE